jgi:hypothetical protein
MFNRDAYPHVEVGVSATVIGMASLLTIRSCWVAPDPRSTVAALLLAWFLVDAKTYLIHYAFDTWEFGWNPMLKLIAHEFKTHHEDYNRVVRNGPLLNGTLYLSILLIVPELALSFLFAPGFAPVFVCALAFLSALVPDVHRWSHMKAPAPVRVLQRCGILISPREHFHHHPGVEGNHRTDWALFHGWTNQILNPFFASSFSWRRDASRAS